MVSKKNILVTGSNGQLGRSLKYISNNFSHNFFFFEKKELDITNHKLVFNLLVKYNIDSIINCAAYTNVNQAEINKELANKVNHIAVENLARVCSELNIQLIHISTDYVFNGNKNTPYNEISITNPVNFYGMTKLCGENKILNYKLENSVIIRTSWLYSCFANNFVNKILDKIKNETEIFVVDDEIGSPTNANDLAEAILELIPRLLNNKTEIYHYSNKGFCSRLQFAQMINEFIKGDCEIFASKNKKVNDLRPKFSALDSTKISKSFGLEIKFWSNSLKTFLQKKNINYTYEI